MANLVNQSKSTIAILGMASAKNFLEAVEASEGESKIVDTNDISNYKGEHRHVFLTFLVKKEGSPLKQTQFAAIPKTEWDNKPTLSNGFIKLAQTTDAEGVKGKEFLLFTTRGL